MQQFMIWRFNYTHQSVNIRRSFVYSSMMPFISIRKRNAVAFQGLLKRSRRGGGCRLRTWGRQQRNASVVASGDRDHFQRQVGERFSSSCHDDFSFCYGSI